MDGHRYMDSESDSDLVHSIKGKEIIYFTIQRERY